MCLGAEEMILGSGDAGEKRNEPPPSKIEALDGSNYEEWSGRMRSAFKRYKLLKLVMGEEKMSEEGDARNRWIEKSAVLYDLILQSVNNDMFQHIKDLVELDDSVPKVWKLLRDVIQLNTLPMVIVLEKELAALSMRPGDDVKPVLDKIKDTYARMAAAGSNVSQMQQCTKIILVLDNSWDNLIPTLNTQQDKWTPEWLRQQILQEDFRRHHTGGGAANKTSEGYGAAGGSRGRGGGRGRGRGRGFGRGRGRGDYNEVHGSSGGRESTRMEGACWYCKKAGHPWFKCFSRPEGWAPPDMKPPSGERARGGAVKGSSAPGDGAHGKADPGMFLMVEDMNGSEGDVGSNGKVVVHPLTHWVIDSGALLLVFGVGNAKVMGANGGLVGLGNVLLVEGLSANLLSVRRLQKSKAKITFGPTSCRAKLGKLLLWDLEEKSSCIKHLWQLPIIRSSLLLISLDDCSPADSQHARVGPSPRQWTEPRALLSAGCRRLHTLHHGLAQQGEVPDVLIPWIRAVRLQLRERFGQDLPVLRLHSERGGEFSSDLLRVFCRGEGILQSFTLPASPQQNGIAERRIGLFYHPTSRRVFPSKDVTFDESVPFYCLFPYRSAPPPPPPLFLAPGPPPIDPLPPQGPAPSGVSEVDPLPCTVPVEVAVGSSAARGALSGDATSGGAEHGGDETERAGSGGADPGGAEPAGMEPRGAESEGEEFGGAEPRGTASSRAAGAGDPAARDTGARDEGVTAGAGGTGGAAAAGPGGDRTRGTGAAETGGVGGAGAGGAVDGDPAEPGGTGAGGTGDGGAGAGGAGAGDHRAIGGGAGGTGAGGAGAGAGAGDHRATGARAGGTGAGGAVSGGTGVGGTMRPRPYFVPLLKQVLGLVSSASLTPPLLCPAPDQSSSPLQPASPLPALSPYIDQTGGLTKRCEPESHPASPVRAVRTGRRVPRPRPPPVPGTHAMELRPSSVPLSVRLPPHPESTLPAVPDPESDLAHAATPTVSRLLATAVTDPSFESNAASALVAGLADFGAACRLDYATALVAESKSASPPSVGGENALGTDVFKDRQDDFHAAAVPRFASMLLAPEGDPDAPDIPTPRSYAEAVTGPYSSQWQAAMYAEIASWKSTGTYVDEVPPPGAKIVDGMWIFRVKRPPGSQSAFKARYVARGFSQRQGVDYFQTFSPTPKITTLWVLLCLAAQCDYELHSLDISTTFLQDSLYEEIWLRRPPGFTGSFPIGTQWSLRRTVYSLDHAPREWHDTLTTTLAAFGFTPATADPSLFIRTDTLLPPFYVLVYVDDLVFAIADTEALTLVKLELQKRHTCTDLGELRTYLGLKITRDRAQRTITLTQSHMVHQVLQRFSFQFSSPQPTPLSTSHSLSTPPSDKSVELSGPYPKLVGCLTYLMTCTRPDLAYPLRLLGRYVAPGRHRKSRCCNSRARK
ncbi:unnamed protein product [Closterium sp. NIES-54]